MTYTSGPWWWEDWDTDFGPEKQTLVARPETKPYPSTMFPDLPNRILRIEDDETSAEDKALIAAAPDMYDALVDLVNEAAHVDHGHWNDWVARLQNKVAAARKAITKATDTNSL